MASTGAHDDPRNNSSLLTKVIEGLRTHLSRTCSILSLDTATALHMLKGGLPPVIVISMYQATSIADIEVTVGYLAAILAVSGQCLLPRAKFMKILFFSILSTCGGAALSCLVVLCSVRARQNISVSVDSSQSRNEGYNSNASVVSAIWLLFTIWLANTLRAFRPVELQDPMVALSIFSVVTMTHTPSFLTVSEGLNFVQRLLKTFLIGLVVAAGVSLCVLPTTNRKTIFKELESYTELIDRFFTAQITFVREEKTTKAHTEGTGWDENTEPSSLPKKCSKEMVTSSLAVLEALQTKLNANLAYSDIEIAWGKLLPEDLRCICNYLQFILLPLAGLGMFPEVCRILPEDLETRRPPSSRNGTETRTSEALAQEVSWDISMNSLEERLVATSELAVPELRVAFELLEIPSSHSPMFQIPFRSPIVERQDNGPAINSLEASKVFHENFLKFKNQRSNYHTIWPAPIFPPADGDECIIEAQEASQARVVEEHFLVFLFMEHPQNELLEGISVFLTYAESKARNTSMRRNKLILPIHHRRKETDRTDSRPHHSFGVQPLAMRDAPRSIAKDAEHLLPTSHFERSSERLSLIPAFLTSSQSVFGFRVALASFTVALLAYLPQTQGFFGAQRVIWALIVIVIGMKPESGASIFGYFTRIAGTVVAVVLSLGVWYIVNGHTAGVLIFLYIANVFEFLGPVTISIVTLNVIIAYELQVKKLGTDIATSTGQPYYPIYLFGPYKLLCVLAGVTASFFWTIFPSPVSTRARARKALGRCIFLLANLYSSMHTTVKIWINEQQGDFSDLSSPGRQLEASNRFLFSKHMLLLADTQPLIHWTTYDLPIGGKFPQRSYQSALSDVQMLATCIALISHTTRDIETLSLTSDRAGSESRPTVPENKNWIGQLALATRSFRFDSHITTSLLCHLAGAMSNNSALPPYLSPPERFPLARRLRQINVQAMDVENTKDPKFTAFACMEVAALLLSFRLEHLVQEIRDLVGEINFESYVRDGGPEREYAV